MTGVKEYIAAIKTAEATPAHKLHKLLDYCVAATGRGEVSSDYAGRIEFPFGGAWVTADPYYGRVSLEDEDDAMHELDERETMVLFEEVGRLLIKFDKKTSETRRAAANEVFDRPLTKLKNL